MVCNLSSQMFSMKLHYPQKGSLMIRLKIKEVAEQKHISQTQLARMAEMDIDTVRRAFRNNGNITMDSLNRFANVLKVHPAELLDYTPDPPAMP